MTRTIGSETSSSAAGIGGWFAYSLLTGHQGPAKTADLLGAPGGLSKSGSGWATVISGQAGGLLANAGSVPTFGADDGRHCKGPAGQAIQHSAA